MKAFGQVTGLSNSKMIRDRLEYIRLHYDIYYEICDDMILSYNIPSKNAVLLHACPSRSNLPIVGQATSSC